MNPNMMKTLTGWLPADADSEEWHKKKKLGSVCRFKTTEIRNYRFLKKFFALLNLGFEYWTPGVISCDYGVPEKNFERFRKDVTILAGYYHTVIRLDGTVRIEADSISFAKMDDDTFSKLYGSVLDVLVKRISVLNKMGKEETNRAVDKLLEFA